jgi:transposase
VSRVEIFERIRRDHEREELSIRALADRHGVHRRTVRQALASATPPPRKVPERGRPAMGPYEELVRGWLRADQDAPKKQRHTARRVWQRLVEEHDAAVAESTIRDFVRQVKAELAAEQLPSVPITQEHPAGAEAEVDFGEFYARIDGQRTRVWLFVMRLSCSAKAFAMCFAHQAQEAFFEGHVLGFGHFGGVPGRIRYDNLKPAVTRMLIGRDRVENERFIALRSHYRFDSFFCLPGIEGAHEKGGVEGEVGRFRRWHLVPVPDVADLAELNTYVRQRLQVDDRRRVTGRAATIGETFETVERAALKPLPDERFDTMRSLSAKVDAKARVCVLQAHYSVPASYAGRRVQVKLGAFHLEVIDPRRGSIIAVWDRSLKKFTQHYELDHYLEILLRKPGALPGSSALAQARARGAFTELHQRFWDTARTTKGDAEGTRRLCEVLLLARRIPADQLAAGIAAALQVGSTDPAVVAVEARRHAGGGEVLALPVPASADAQVGAAFDRPAPSLVDYDTLLEVPS